MTVATRLHREWQRFTPLKRLSRFAFYLFAVAALVVSLQTIDVIPEFLYDAPEQMADLFRRMWPPDPSYIGPTLRGMVETLHIATVGPIIAIVLAIPVGLLAARNVTPNLPLNLLAKFVFVTSRSINSLVWALLFVAVFGPGPLAGTLAIAFRSIGFTGKLFAEAMEESNKGSIEALTASRRFETLDSVAGVIGRRFARRSGRSPCSDGILTSASPRCSGSSVPAASASHSIRRSILLYWDQVAVVLIAIFVVVIVAEIIVTMVRAKVL